MQPKKVKYVFRIEDGDGCGPFTGPYNSAAYHAYKRAGMYSRHSHYNMPGPCDEAADCADAYAALKEIKKGLRGDQMDWRFGFQSRELLLAAFKPTVRRGMSDAGCVVNVYETRHKRADRDPIVFNSQVVFHKPSCRRVATYSLKSFKKEGRYDDAKRTR